MKVRTSRIQRRTLYFWGIVACVLFTSTSVVDAEEIVIIAHSDVAAESLERAAISETYLGTRTRWDSGEKIRVVMLKKVATHEQFVQDIVKTTPAKLRKLWKKVVFTGAGTPPKILKTETDLIEFVAETEGAISYIDSSTAHEGVKVISIQQ
ncbi:MAG: hypothetical protein GY801_44525 [bacterium]|nr:hypothetical protein [bacterium]